MAKPGVLLLTNCRALRSRAVKRSRLQRLCTTMERLLNRTTVSSPFFSTTAPGIRKLRCFAGQPRPGIFWPPRQLISRLILAAEIPHPRRQARPEGLVPMVPVASKLATPLPGHERTAVLLTRRGHSLTIIRYLGR